jgi:hypothetical protein
VTSPAATAVVAVCSGLPPGMTCLLMTFVKHWRGCIRRHQHTASGRRHKCHSGSSLTWHLDCPTVCVAAVVTSGFWRSTVQDSVTGLQVASNVTKAYLGVGVLACATL